MISHARRIEQMRLRAIELDSNGITGLKRTDAGLGRHHFAAIRQPDMDPGLLAETLDKIDQAGKSVTRRSQHNMFGPQTDTPLAFQ
jgi:hypothetical protein